MTERYDYFDKLLKMALFLLIENVTFVSYKT